MILEQHSFELCESTYKIIFINKCCVPSGHNCLPQGRCTLESALQIQISVGDDRDKVVVLLLSLSLLTLLSVEGGMRLQSGETAKPKEQDRSVYEPWFVHLRNVRLENCAVIT